MSIEYKLKQLRRILQRLDSVVLAYSGGVDSSFLLRVAKDHIRDLIAVTADSQTYTKNELKFAKLFCKNLGIRHQIISTKEFNDKNFTNNPRERCYFCKKE